MFLFIYSFIHSTSSRDKDYLDEANLFYFFVRAINGRNLILSRVLPCLLSVLEFHFVPVRNQKKQFLLISLLLFQSTVQIAVIHHVVVGQVDFLVPFE